MNWQDKYIFLITKEGVNDLEKSVKKSTLLKNPD